MTVQKLCFVWSVLFHGAPWSVACAGYSKLGLLNKEEVRDK
jgi:hypothetical protein